MDIIFASSNHAKDVLENSKFEMTDKNNPNNKQMLQLNTKVEVLFEGVKLDKFYNIKQNEKTKLFRVFRFYSGKLLLFTYGALDARRVRRR